MAEVEQLWNQIIAQQQQLDQLTAAFTASVTRQAAQIPAQAGQPSDELCSIIDTRVLGKPESFEGVEAKWLDWSVAVRAYMSLVNARLGVFIPKDFV